MAVSVLCFLLISMYLRQDATKASNSEPPTSTDQKNKKQKTLLPLAEGPENGYLNDRNLFGNSHPTPAKTKWNNGKTVPFPQSPTESKHKLIFRFTTPPLHHRSRWLPSDSPAQWCWQG